MSTCLDCERKNSLLKRLLNFLHKARTGPNDLQGLSLIQQIDNELAGCHGHAGEAMPARGLLDRSVDVMSTLHRSIEPMEDDPELAGRVPPEAMRAFVDALADIDRDRCRLKADEDGWETRRG